jgi:SAM-dependent methyltransferase
MRSEEAEKLNQIFWDEIAPIHKKSYDIKSLKNKISQIDEIQKNEFYPIKNKSLLHLQCHIGTDSISLALDGANVTAVDFSEKSIEIAKKLNNEIGTDVKFIISSIFDLKSKLNKKYDIVYTSMGVLCWISDIRKWAEIISYYLKKDGIFYIMETHPIKNIFDDTVENDLKVKHSYFNQNEPVCFDDDWPDYSDYSDQTYVPKNKSYEWIWSLSDIINALIENGLQIELFNEYDKLFFNGFKGMVEDKNGWWYLEKYKGKIPYTFSLRARKI